MNCLEQYHPIHLVAIHRYTWRFSWTGVLSLIGLILLSSWFFNQQNSLVKLSRFLQLKLGFASYSRIDELIVILSGWDHGKVLLFRYFAIDPAKNGRMAFSTALIPCLPREGTCKRRDNVHGSECRFVTDFSFMCRCRVLRGSFHWISSLGVPGPNFLTLVFFWRFQFLFLQSQKKLLNPLFHLCQLTEQGSAYFCQLAPKTSWPHWSNCLESSKFS